MICPEAFYETELKGKTPEQIMTVIRSLKQNIGRLKNRIEYPDYRGRKIMISPSEEVQIACNRLYLEKAKQALVEAGGIYVPSAAEQKAKKFDENIPFISKIEFFIGGYFCRGEWKSLTISDDKIFVCDDPKMLKKTNLYDGGIKVWDKDEFFNEFKELHIGEWRKNYDPKRFGFVVMDGTQWHLEIYYSNGHRPVKIYGDNDYPYNFDRLLELLEIEEYFRGE